MKTIRIITAIPKKNIKHRVVTYCRVSTYGPAQLCNLELQIKIYTRMIRSHPGWIFAGVFFDVGKSELLKDQVLL
ncbi:hypothetical protein SAMN02745215_04257 [Desulfitobacterium chlororespirans DSM 11544]|uniref:Resolvase, N terminal domain n=1 Tax=Desulfitobacterium chlororespirans DSM 11544 TaxID=1121395 RepID=A0A1M7UNI9_9FIRM|nr:hypothetical protein SAMN02745215_04257 [Desulfitobacterium chlororespirans DSM 11544]